MQSGSVQNAYDPAEIPLADGVDAIGKCVTIQAAAGATLDNLQY
jgi:hypothetical protein